MNNCNHVHDCTHICKCGEHWRSRELKAKIYNLRRDWSRSDDEIQQTLGKALGYPWFKDDQVNFPGATEAEGVCVGDHVAGTIAMEAAREIKCLKTELAAAYTALSYFNTSPYLKSRLEALR